RLGVERIENGLDQQKIDAPVDEALDLFRIGLPQLVERDGTKPRIGNVRRNRSGAVGRTDGTRGKPRAAVFLLRDIGGGTRQPRAFEIELVGNGLHAIVGLRDPRRRERVGRYDVGAGAEIGKMDVVHRLRLRQNEEIVVAAYLAVPGIETRTAKTAL